jgi:hypothetical protein
MTILETMTARALADFDDLVVRQEQIVRDNLAAQGRSRKEIDAHIASCRPNLEAQRAEVARMVANQLMKAGIPLDGDARVLSH